MNKRYIYFVSFNHRKSFFGIPHLGYGRTILSINQPIEDDELKFYEKILSFERRIAKELNLKTVLVMNYKLIKIEDIK
jgi:hypothetical protein